MSWIGSREMHCIDSRKMSWIGSRELACEPIASHMCMAPVIVYCSQIPALHDTLLPTGQKIGNGEFGDVFAATARHLRPGQPQAIKVCSFCASTFSKQQGVYSAMRTTLYLT